MPHKEKRSINKGLVLCGRDKFFVALLLLFSFEGGRGQTRLGCKMLGRADKAFPKGRTRVVRRKITQNVGKKGYANQSPD